jgi:type II secretory pathway pseudopilin PulG
MSGMPQVSAQRMRQQSGFSYLWLLMLVALMGLGLSVVGDVHVTLVKREREKELLAIGRQFQTAIRRYHDFRPGGAPPQYPHSLDDLLLDPRAPGTLRHLRKIYVDPMTGDPLWGLIKKGDRVVGVHSLSDAAVLKQSGFEPGQESLEGKEKYSQWHFVVSTELEAQPPAAQPDTLGNKNDGSAEKDQ